MTYKEYKCMNEIRVKLDDFLYQRLDKHSKSRDISKSEIVRQALMKYYFEG